jgi:outer membrane lipoprotein-sorting protein
MKQRIAVGSVAALVIATAALLWIVSAPRPAYAMDRLAESIRQARSYEYTMTMDINLPREPGKAPVKVATKGQFSWQAPGSYRIETTGSDAMPGLDSLMIFPAGKPGIDIDRKAKKYVRQPARLGQISPLMIVDKLSTFSGQADRLLGTKEIDGKTAKGFRIEARKIDPDVYSGPVEIWVDTESNLPLSISYEMNTSGVPATIRMMGFRWNLDLDPKLFDPSPPEGYAETVPPASPVDDQVRKITTGLKLYAKYSGGHYPRVKMLYGDVMRDEFVKLSGAPYPPRKEEDAKDVRVAEAYDATWGFSTINVILRDNGDAVYHGKTVGPEDKDKILLRWKLENGSYEVIYGDLRAEAVTAGRLRFLEGR